MKTNVYVANYEDLSQLSVNAENLSTAVQEFAQIKNEEPMLLQRKITGIQIPDPPEPLPVAVIFCRAEREEEGETLPDTVTVRPSPAIERSPGDVVMLYAIDTAPDPTVEFVGWYNALGLRISTDANFAFTVPEVTTSGETIELVAKFRAKVGPTVFTVTVDTAMSDGTSVPDSCVARPTSIQCNEGDSVNLYAIVTDPAYKFVHWADENGDVLSTDANFAYTPTASATVTAVFDEV